MHDLPIMLKVRGQRCLVVGGGAVALRRAEALHAAGAVVVVVAPVVDEALTQVAAQVERRPYRADDLADVRLVVIATDDPAVNETVARDAAERGVLSNRADAPGNAPGNAPGSAPGSAPTDGDFTVPAHAHHGPITLAVHTGGVSAQAAAAIRRQLSAALDPDWAALLTAVAPYRGQIQARFADTADRRERLRRLTDGHAMNILKAQGLAALHAHCESLVKT